MRSRKERGRGNYIGATNMTCSLEAELIFCRCSFFWGFCDLYVWFTHLRKGAFLHTYRSEERENEAWNVPRLLILSLSNSPCSWRRSASSAWSENWIWARFKPSWVPSQSNDSEGLCGTGMTLKYRDLARDLSHWFNYSGVVWFGAFDHMASWRGAKWGKHSLSLTRWDQ